MGEVELRHLNITIHRIIAICNIDVAQGLHFILRLISHQSGITARQIACVRVQ
jgi:hypothetical protein